MPDKEAEEAATREAKLAEYRAAFEDYVSESGLNAENHAREASSENPNNANVYPENPNSEIRYYEQQLQISYDDSDYSREKLEREEREKEEREWLESEARRLISSCPFWVVWDSETQQSWLGKKLAERRKALIERTLTPEKQAESNRKYMREYNQRQRNKKVVERRVKELEAEELAHQEELRHADGLQAYADVQREVESYVESYDERFLKASHRDPYANGFKTKLDFLDKRFGKLITLGIHFESRASDGSPLINCLCDCGCRTTVSLTYITTRKVPMCNMCRANRPKSDSPRNITRRELREALKNESPEAKKARFAEREAKRQREQRLLDSIFNADLTNLPTAVKTHEEIKEEEKEAKAKAAMQAFYDSYGATPKPWA